MKTYEQVTAERLRQEIAAFESDERAKAQATLDRLWQAKLDARFNRPDAISEYDPVRRLDAELDYAQAEADRAYARRHFNR
jgi:hypothetical protein